MNPPLNQATHFSTVEETIQNIYASCANVGVASRGSSTTRGGH